MATPSLGPVLPAPTPLAQDATSVPPSTLIGPTGTAPGLNFIAPAERPIDDSSNTTTFSWPLGFAMLFLLAVVVVVLVRALRGARAGRS